MIPKEKVEILAKADKDVEAIDTQYRRGLITDEERYLKTVDVWTEATETVTRRMLNTFDPFNPLYMMAQSGARGNIQQIRQLAGMRGLMTDPSGRIIELPIKANFREGLTVLEYFISTHGQRKGLADTAIRTSESGYLTRRLVDVAQDVIVRDDDCKPPRASRWCRSWTTAKWSCRWRPDHRPHRGRGYHRAAQQAGDRGSRRGDR